MSPLRSPPPPSCADAPVHSSACVPVLTLVRQRLHNFSRVRVRRWPRGGIPPAQREKITIARRQNTPTPSLRGGAPLRPQRFATAKPCPPLAPLAQPRVTDPTASETLLQPPAAPSAARPCGHLKAPTASQKSGGAVLRFDKNAMHAPPLTSALEARVLPCGRARLGPRPVALQAGEPPLGGGFRVGAGTPDTHMPRAMPNAAGNEVMWRSCRHA